MPVAKNVRNVVIHCSAGFGDVNSIKKYWKEVLGWEQVGYHLIVDLDGNITQLAPFKAITNGVAGHNAESIHICYIGGIRVEKKDGKTVYTAEDTRTEKQKLGIHRGISLALSWLKAEGKDITKDLTVCGHRDFSPDRNGNGLVDKNERIKECPSFDALREYDFYTSKDRKGKLPTARVKSTSATHIVVKGDTLLKIATHYDLTLTQIIEKNNLQSTVIRIGQVLKV